MYSLLVSSRPWDHRRDTMSRSRILQGGHTHADLINRFHPGGELDLESLARLPALFVEEYLPGAGQYAHVGRISRAYANGRDVHLEYNFDDDIDPILMDDVFAHAAALRIDMPHRGFTELETTHWAVKDVNLFEIILTRLNTRGRTPQLFALPTTPAIDRLQLSAMMPFGGFDAVYAAIRDAAQENGMRCDRADTVWQNLAIIDDVAHLIDRSNIVVVDCTGMNPNVYYELGLAHAWGKKVIIITQQASDIPFDVQHLRNIRYLNNGEGLENLRGQLSARIRTLL